MEYHEKLDNILGFFYNRLENGQSRHIHNPKYDLNVSDENEISILENHLVNDGLIDIIKTRDGKNIAITPNGIAFYRKGAYTSNYQQQILEQQEQDRIQIEESNARQATIEQAEYAKKAYKISERAFWVSVIAIIISIITALIAII